MKLAGERSLRPAPKRFPPLGRLANGIEKNANESTIHNNNIAERTKYDQTTIMTRFTRKSNSTEEDVTGFSSLCSGVVLNSGHPVQKSKFGACAVTGYCSFKGPDMLAEFDGVSVFFAWRNDAVWFLYLVLNLFSVSPMYDSVVLLSLRVTVAW